MKRSSSAGTPIAGATVSLIESGQVVLQTVTDSNGVNNIYLSHPGIFDLIATSDNASFTPVTGIVANPGNTIRQNFVAGSATLQITLTDPSNSVRGASAQLLQTLDGQIVPGASITMLYNVGSFQNLAPGTYLLTGHTLNGIEAGQDTISVSAGQAVT